MKTRFKTLALMLLSVVVATGSARAQSLSDILGTVKGVVEDLTASKDFKISDIAGTYSYSAPAVSLKGDNALKNIGGSAAATQLENKLAPFYKTVGFDKLVMTINPDSTFTMKTKLVTFNGTISKDEDGLAFTFDRLPSHPVKCLATKSGNKLSLCFDASKLISVMETVSKYISLSSVKTVVSLLKSYDNLYIGFQLTKTGDAATDLPATDATVTDAPAQATDAPAENKAASAIGSLLKGLKK